MVLHEQAIHGRLQLNLILNRMPETTAPRRHCRAISRKSVKIRRWDRE